MNIGLIPLWVIEMWLKASFRLGVAGGGFLTFCSAYPTPTLGLRYAYATEVGKWCAFALDFNTSWFSSQE